MNQIVRNLVVVFFGAASSVLVAVLLLFIEARGGEPLFGYALWTYLPLGAIGAGFVGAAGYLAGSLAMRVRPAVIMLPAFVGVAAGTVLLVQSAEFGMFMDGRQVAGTAGSFAQFLGSSVLHSQLKFSSSGDVGDSSSSSSSAPAPSRPIVAGDASSSVQGIGGGVQNMMSTQDPTRSSALSRPMAQINRLSNGIDSLDALGQSNSARLQLLGLQTAGFLIGGLAVFGFLRSRTHCAECSLFLSSKGVQTRYFVREHEIKSSVEGVLAMAKVRQLQQSIMEHSGKGSGEKTRFSEFASTIEIHHCTGCERHSVNYSAKRKKGGSWKEISMLGYATASLGPIDLAARVKQQDVSDRMAGLVSA